MDRVPWVLGGVWTLSPTLSSSVCWVGLGRAGICVGYDSTKPRVAALEFRGGWELG